MTAPSVHEALEELVACKDISLREGGVEMSREFRAWANARAALAAPPPAAGAEVAGRLRAIYTVVSSGRQRPLSVPEQVAIKEAADTIDRLTAERDELRSACTVLRAMLDHWHSRPLEGIE